jgi:hypothetical protein
VELIVPVIGIGLQNPGKGSKMPDGMFVPPAAGGVIKCRRRSLTAKGTVVPDIGPDVPLDLLALRQYRHRGIVAQPFGRQDIGLDQGMERLQDHGAGADRGRPASRR